MTPDYYTPPDGHPNALEIERFGSELDELQLEYDCLTAEDAEWTAEGEARCIELEKQIEELTNIVNYLTHGDDL